jgi:hypothetical protein
MTWLYTILGLLGLFLAYKVLCAVLDFYIAATNQTKRGMSVLLETIGGNLIIFLGFLAFLCVYVTQPPIKFDVWESAEWRTEVIESTSVDGILTGISRRYRNQRGSATYLWDNAKALSRKAQRLARSNQGNACSSITSDSKDLVLQFCVQGDSSRFEVTYPITTAPALAKAPQDNNSQ